MSDVHVDSHDGRPIFFGCAICKGKKRRSRKGAGGSICKNNGCSKEWTARRRAAQREDSGDDEEAPELTQCYEVEKVLGVSLCQLSTLTKRQRRVGRELSARDIFCEVRGGFGEDEDDKFIPDTRWVPLKELVENVGQEGLTELTEFASTLKKTLKKAQEKLKEELEEEDEAE